MKQLLKALYFAPLAFFIACDGTESAGNTTEIENAIAFRRHVGQNDARAHLENGDAVLRQPVREKLRHHGDARLGDAVFPAGGGGGVGGNRRNIDDARVIIR